MASQTTYDCDGCGRSVPDPGTISTLDITTYELKDGTKYLGKKYKHDERDLCPSCLSNVEKAIKRA